MELFTETKIYLKYKSNPFNINSINYSILSSLKCPLRFYINNIIKYTYVNKYILIGSITHFAYETQIKNNIKPIFSFFNKDFFNKSFSFYLNSYSNIDKKDLDNILKDKEEIYQTVKYNLNKSFIHKLNYMKKKCQILTEDKHRFTTINFLDSDIILYSKPDILLVYDDKIEIIDIKIGKFSYMYKTQLLIYAYNMLFSNQLKRQKYIGKIYLTKEKSLKEMFVTNPYFIKNIINKFFIDLTYLYKSLNIKNTTDLENFAKNICNYKQQELKMIFDFIILVNGKKTCSYCPVINICPIRHNKNNNIFNKLINTQSNSIRLIFLKNINKTENLII